MKLIGEGANAQVYRAYYKQPETQKNFIYAVKIFRHKVSEIPGYVIYLG